MKLPPTEFLIIGACVGYVWMYQYSLPLRASVYVPEIIGVVTGIFAVYHLGDKPAQLVAAVVAGYTVMEVVKSWWNKYEYLDENEQKAPAKSVSTPLVSSSGVPSPEVKGMLEAMMKGAAPAKGDRMPQTTGKSATKAPTPSVTAPPPKPAVEATTEKFSVF
jgi:hypothetical protein